MILDVQQVSVIMDKDANVLAHGRSVIRRWKDF